MRALKVLCCGSRTFTFRSVVKWRLTELPEGTTIIHGDARGADTMADFAARELGFSVRSYPADWEHDGRGAGPRRNARMLEKEHPGSDGLHFDLCLAFTDDIVNSKGTRDMVKRCLAAGIPVEIIDSKGQRRTVTAV